MTVVPHTLHHESIEIKMADGIFVKSHAIKRAGLLVEQHKHGYDHLTMLATGSIRVWKNDELLGDFEAPCGLLIEKSTSHKFLTLEANTLIYCIHNIKDAEEVDIHEEAS